MMRFRLILIGILSVAIMLFFVEEYVQLPLIGNLSISLYVYAMAVLIMTSVIVYPEFAQKSTPVVLMGITLVYMMFKSVSIASTVIDPTFMYVTIAELGLLYVAFYAARNVSLSITSMEDSIHNTVFQIESRSVLSEQDGEKAITEEILRARRYERGLSLLYVQVPRLYQKPFGGWNTGKIQQYEYVCTRVVQMIRNLTTNETDIVAWHKNNLVVCLPESSQEEVTNIVTQLDALLTVSLPEKSTITTARFPNDALVYEDLIAATMNVKPVKTEPIPLRRTSEVPSTLMDSA